MSNDKGRLRSVISVIGGIASIIMGIVILRAAIQRNVIVANLRLGIALAIGGLVLLVTSVIDIITVFSSGFREFVKDWEQENKKVVDAVIIILILVVLALGMLILFFGFTGYSADVLIFGFVLIAL